MNRDLNMELKGFRDLFKIKEIQKLLGESNLPTTLVDAEAASDDIKTEVIKLLRAECKKKS